MASVSRDDHSSGMVSAAAATQSDPTTAPLIKRTICLAVCV